MLYREVGQYKTNYAADMAVFPILQDRIGIAVILFVAFVVIPLIGNNFVLNSVLIPFLIFSLAAIGLNLLTGYAGLLSLGTGAFMGVGAYACLKLTTIFPHVNIVIWILASGLFSAAVGALFGLPSLRIKGFISRWRRSPRSSSGVVLHPRPLAVQLQRLGCDRGAAAEARRRADYRTHRHVADALSGRAEHRRRDDLVGVEPRAWPYRPHVDVGSRHGPRRRAGRHPVAAHQALAFAVSSFYCGVAGAMMVFLWYGGAEADVFAIDQSFLVLFMVIIGGLGTLIGSFFGAALIYILPIALRAIPQAFGLPIRPAAAEQLTFVIVGVLIIVFLILEPNGLARLWQIGKQKLRVWPFPY
jgi:branched-chain amino acid transport system permease protein